MLVLAVDTSTPAVSAAVVRVGSPDRVVLIAERITVDARAHGELLGPAIRAALTDARAEPADLAAVVAGLGPGPFTGLRVGLVTAAALGQTLAVPTYGVCSLDGIGLATTGTVVVATDARRKEVYWAIYHDGARVDGPAVSRPAGLADLVVEVAVGDAAPLLAAWFPVRPEPRYPQPAVLVRAAAARICGAAPSESLTPMYLRRPDAVEPGARKMALP